MSMKKTILNILSKLILVTVILLGASVLNTCTAPTKNDEIRKNEIKFDTSKFYFNKYEKFQILDSTRSKHSVHHDNGFIQIYGDVVRIKTTTSDIIYDVIERFYDEDTQVYEFYSDKAIIEFDVVSKVITVFNKDNSGMSFKINSTVKSNW